MTWGTATDSRAGAPGRARAVSRRSSAEQVRLQGYFSGRLPKYFSLNRCEKWLG
jgi:hypothetical protein